MTRSSNRPAVGVVFLLGCLSFPPAACASEKTGVRTQAFNGENLDGWHVTGCEVAVEDGKLVIKSGDGLIRSDHRYRDCIVELDWRARKPSQWDSGVYFRADLPPEGKPWPARYQVNLEQGNEGNVKPLPDARSTGLIKPGEWNHFKLTVVGQTAELEINGRRAWKAKGVQGESGYVGFQAEVAKGGEFEFKEIHITELDHRPLFNGQDLAGWEGGGAEASLCWAVNDGLLLCTGQQGPWLRSKEKVGDFNLRLEYKLKDGGNSGVYVRVPEDGNHHGPGAGVEVQILDDHSERYKVLEPYQYCGSVYKIAPAKPRVGREPGRWNSLEINCVGSDYRVTHNGVVVVDARSDEFPELKERLVEGFLGLQNHSEEVYFRNIRLGPPQ